MIFRTTFRETLSSRQIALIALPWTKNARRIFAIVSTISIPTSAPIIMEASVDPQPRGPDWMPITPKTGSLLHADSHTAASLIAGRGPPARDAVDTALGVYAAEIAAARHERLMQDLPSGVLERIFGLGLA